MSKAFRGINQHVYMPTVNRILISIIVHQQVFARNDPAEFQSLLGVTAGMNVHTSMEGHPRSEMLP